ncbi:hypothetical protein ACMBCM_06990, partial [Spiroplasma sp. K1]
KYMNFLSICTKDDKYSDIFYKIKFFICVCKNIDIYIYIYIIYIYTRAWPFKSILLEVIISYCITY